MGVEGQKAASLDSSPEPALSEAEGARNDKDDKGWPYTPT